MFVPGELGGGGVSLPAVAQACFTLGRSDAATAMVFAMHQIQVVTIVRHLAEAPAWYREYLRELSAEQRLIASVTSEVGTGGDMGRTLAAVMPGETGDARLRLEKQAPTVSYGAHADDLFTTARRGLESEPGDQVMVLSRAAETELEPAGSWDTLGMRGTCSPGPRHLHGIRVRAPGWIR
jgi:acyl-CoA dehydrogenase